MSEENKTELKKKLQVVTPECRVSHPHVFKASQMIVNGTPQGKPNFSIELLAPKATTDIKDLMRPLNEAARQKWGSDKSQWPTPLQMPVRDGDKPHGKKKEVKAEHKGMYVIKASSSGEYQAPYVVARDPNVKLQEADFYPGCYARAALKAHAYTFADKDGVKFILDGVQKTRDGEAFGGKRPANEVFGMLEDDSDTLDSLGDTEDDDFSL